jgi:hypothetical protein
MPYVFILMLLALSACSAHGDRRELEQSPPTIPSPVTLTTPVRSDSLGGVDFRNFTYPNHKGLDGILLVDGEQPVDEEPWSLSGFEAGDLNGDGSDDAIVTLFMHTLGTMSLSRVYVFDVSRSGGPHVMWWFSSGDRAQGGLRRVMARNGTLVVELYGYGTTPERTLAKPGDGPLDAACCPSHFTRTEYRWSGRRFDRTKPPVILDNPTGSLGFVPDE